MPTVAELHQQLEALQKIRSSGEKMVRFGEREITFRSDDELASAIADLERQLATTAGQQVRKVRFHTFRGT